MRATLLIAVIASILVVTGFVSAQNECGWESTVVDGTIYQAGGNPNQNPIEGASVMVTCEHNGVNSTSGALSLSNGHYSVIFTPDECDQYDTVTVSATHPSYGDGVEPGSIEYNYQFGGCGCEVNVGVVDVPLIPEFGIMIGGLTAIGALVAFFVIRKQ